MRPSLARRPLRRLAFQPGIWSTRPPFLCAMGKGGLRQFRGRFPLARGAARNAFMRAFGPSTSRPSSRFPGAPAILPGKSEADLVGEARSASNWSGRGRPDHYREASRGGTDLSIFMMTRSSLESSPFSSRHRKNSRFAGSRGSDQSTGLAICWVKPAGSSVSRQDAPGSPRKERRDMDIRFTERLTEPLAALLDWCRPRASSSGHS